MASEMYEKVNLMLRLYDMRREEKLRKARQWYVDNYAAGTPEEMLQKYPPGSEENAYIRMVVSYWDMCAAIANRGMVDEDLFFQQSGEAWLVFEKIRNIVPAWRAAFANPLIFAELEQFVNRLEEWREKRAPGTTEATRKMMEALRQARAQAAKSA
jgi:hypothetical protein